MRILVATDAWRPQLNGVVRTYERLAVEGNRLGVNFEFLTPEPFPTLPLPTYPEIRLAVVGEWNVESAISRVRPDYIHIATEGPIGLAARGWCLRKGHPFTSSYHTRFPDYVSARVPVPLSWGYALQRWFHNSAAGVMVAAPSLASDLKSKGFRRIMPWTRGVDTNLFRPRPDAREVPRDRPVFLYVGRIAVEKGVESFLALDLPGSKVVVGDGPQLEELRRRFPTVRFTGPKVGEELASEYAAADVFVFPSQTDTFGIVLLEAMASGLPVAALPVTGPIDIVRDGETGCLDTDLRSAAMRALSLDRKTIRLQALGYGWANCAGMFIDNVLEANREAGHRPVAHRPAELTASA